MAGRNPDKPDMAAEAIDRVRSAYGEAAAEIAAMSDAEASFAKATELANVLRELADASADVRAKAVARIWESEKMSLASLAQRIGVSKARADQLMKAAKPKPVEES